MHQFHGRRLELVGDGEWRLGRLAAVGLSASGTPSQAGEVPCPMEDGMFTPTLDWGNELWHLAEVDRQGWLIAAVATLVICVLIARFTVWGRQFWRITGDYFNGPESVKVWLWLGGDPAVGDHRRPAFGAVQLPGQRHDDQLPGRRVRASPLAMTR